MRKLIFVLIVGFTISGTSCFSQSEKPNILLITVDDMNWDSPGAFGNPNSELTPHIDQLAEEGVKFTNAYVTASNCAPSRVSIQTGLYPQQSGARGFYYIDDSNIESIPTKLKSLGYYTGVLNKNADTNPSPDVNKYWNYYSGFKQAEKYSSAAYSKKSNAFFEKSLKSEKPFYFTVNIADPHKPFYNDPVSKKKGFDEFKPSIIIEEIPMGVPAFLPNISGVKEDLINYYNSVKRADDCVGAILASLKKAGLSKNTLVIFLSDHGMPFPFAKSSVYPNGLKTPLIMKWEGKFEKGATVQNAMVSTIDIFPTIMDAVGESSEPESKRLGVSVLKIMETQDAYTNRKVYGNFDENARGLPFPMRGLISKKWNYVFNAWAVGDRKFKSASIHHKAFKSMNKAAKTDPMVKERIQHHDYRTVEELYDLENDPNCLNNLADDENYHSTLKELRKEMEQHLRKTDDYLLESFLVKDNEEAFYSFMQTQLDESMKRANSLKWKRWENLAGPAKKNTALFQPEL